MITFVNKLVQHLIETTLELLYIYRYFCAQVGVQLVSLGAGCVQHGVVLHELLHTLGLWHEQSRLDRDQYVRILWENIRTGKEDNFAK